MPRLPGTLWIIVSALALGGCAKVDGFTCIPCQSLHDCNAGLTCLEGFCATQASEAARCPHGGSTGSSSGSTGSTGTSSSASSGSTGGPGDCTRPLLSDGDFEQALGWTASDGMTLTRSTAFAASGEWSAHLTPTCQGCSGVAQSAQVPVKAGATYTARATLDVLTARPSDGTGTVFSIAFFDAAGDLVSIASRPCDRSQVQRVTATAVAPEGAVTASVQLVAQAKFHGAYLDNVTLLAGTCGAPGLTPSSVPGHRIVETLSAAGDGGRLDGPLSAARFNDPQGLAFDESGALLVAENGNGDLRSVDLDAGAVRSVSHLFPITRVVAAGGRVWVSLTAISMIIEVFPSDGGLSAFAGTGSNGFQDGLIHSALFNQPYGLMALPSGGLLIADALNNRLREVSGNQVSTFAGEGAPGWLDGPAEQAQLSGPRDLALDLPHARVIVIDTDNNRVRSVSLASGITATLAGDGWAGLVDGPAALARFSAPLGVALDAEGSIYVADWGNDALRKLDTQGEVVTLAGGNAGFLDGPAGNDGVAQLSRPTGIALDARGWLYFTDGAANALRVLRPAY